MLFTDFDYLVNSIQRLQFLIRFRGNFRIFNFGLWVFKFIGILVPLLLVLKRMATLLNYTSVNTEHSLMILPNCLITLLPHICIRERYAVTHSWVIKSIPTRWALGNKGYFPLHIVIQTNKIYIVTYIKKWRKITGFPKIPPTRENYKLNRLKTNGISIVLFVLPVSYM